MVSPQDEQRLAHAMLGLRIAVVLWALGVLWSGYEYFDLGLWTTAIAQHVSAEVLAIAAFEIATVAALPLAPLLAVTVILPRDRVPTWGLVGIYGLCVVVLAVRTIGWTTFCWLLGDNSLGYFDQMGTALWGASSGLEWMVIPIAYLVAVSSGRILHQTASVHGRLTTLPLFAAMAVAFLSWLHLPVITVSWIRFGVGLAHHWALGVAIAMSCVTFSLCILFIVWWNGPIKWLARTQVAAITALGVTVVSNVVTILLVSSFRDWGELGRHAIQAMQLVLVLGSAALPMLMVWVLGWRRRA
ncbi:MAG: hypothetical protein AAGI46_11905 [Planctomycetota bacterium]